MTITMDKNTLRYTSKMSIVSTVKGQIVNFSNGVCIDYFTTNLLSETFLLYMFRIFTVPGIIECHSMT